MPHGGDMSKVPIATSVSLEDAGSKLNVSRRSVARAKFVLDYCKPEQIKAIEEGEKALSVIQREIKHEKSEFTKIINLTKNHFPIGNKIRFEKLMVTLPRY